MTLSGTRFGDLEFGPSDVLFFREGLIGFPNLHEFVLLSHKEDSPFRWLQSVQEPSLAFLCAMPERLVDQYNPTLTIESVESLNLAERTSRFLLVTASIPHGKPSEMTVNLLAPILVNVENQSAIQFVVENEAYTVKHRVFPEATSVSEKVAA